MLKGKITIRSWRQFLLLWAVFLLLLGLIGCGVLYRYLGVYEQTRPELYMDELMASMTAEDFLRQVEIDTDLPVSEFEDAVVLYRQYLDGLDTKAPLSYQSESRLGDKDRADFAVRAGGSRLCVVTLTADGPGQSFGRHGWRLDRIHSGDFTKALQSTELRINALADQLLLLNGKPIGQSYLDGEAAPAALSELERRFQPVTGFAQYRIGPLYGDLALTDAQGEPIPLTRQEDLRITADAAEFGKYDLVITAPADLTVSVGGIALDPTDAKSSAGILEGLESMVAADYQCLTYTLPGIYGEPEIFARDEKGTVQEPVWGKPGHCRFFYENDPAAEAELKPVAERFFQSFVTYTSSAFNESRYFDLLAHIRPGTALYDYIAQSKDAMIWAPYSQTEFAQLQYDNFRLLNSRCFLCTVRYNADVSFFAKDEQYSYGMESAYELAFQLADTGWIALAMSAVE